MWKESRTTLSCLWELQIGRINDEYCLRRWEASVDEDGETSRGQSKRALDLDTMLDTCCAILKT